MSLGTLDDISDEEIEQKTIDKISNIRDLQHLYGTLYELGLDYNSDYVGYMSVDNSNVLDLIDEPNSVVYLDIYKNNGELYIKDVEVDKLYKEDIGNKPTPVKVGISRSNGNRDKDHSISHKLGSAKSSKVAKYLTERITEWPEDDFISEFCDNTNLNAQFIDKIRNINISKEYVQKILETKFGEEFEVDGAILTLRFNVENENNWSIDTNGKDVIWPGEIEVLNEAMKYRLIKKLSKTGIKKGEASGEGLCYITDEEDEKVFGTIDDTLGIYSVKQAGDFQNLDNRESWRSHPISGDAAIKIRNSEKFIDSCSTTTEGLSIYYLPYLIGELTPEKSRKIYKILKSISESENKNQISSFFKKRESEKQNKEKLLKEMEVFMIISDNDALKNRVIFDESSVRFDYIYKFSKAHNNLLNSWLFNEVFTKTDYNLKEDNMFYPSLIDKKMDEAKFKQKLSSFSYFDQTLSTQNEGINNKKINFTRNIVLGKGINKNTLLREYIEKIKEDNDQDNIIPRPTIKSQFSQLLVLQKLNIIEGNNNINMEDDKLKEKSIDNIVNKMDLEKGKEIPFLIGVLVGKVSSYQKFQRNINDLVIDNHKISNMDKVNLKKAYVEATDKNTIYSSDEDYSVMYKDLLNRINAKSGDIEELNLNLEEIQFNYALGVTYGLAN